MKLPEQGMNLPEVTLEMTPCKQCNMLLHLPFLQIESGNFSGKFCSWECYRKYCDAHSHSSDPWQYPDDYDVTRGDR